MYSFVSTNDFGHKTGYVSDITHCSDWDSNGDFYPLEQIYEFDNLFTRFQSEIDYAINNGGTFDTGSLRIARFYELDSTGSGGAPALRNSYLCVRLYVGSNQIRVYYGYTGYVNNHRDISYSDYLNGTPEYNTGRLHLVRFVDPDITNGGVLSNRFTSGLMLGSALVYSGTWEEPSYTYPHGVMRYRNGTNTIPRLIPVGNASQTGYPTDSTQALMAQPEIVGYVYNQYYYSLSKYQLMLVDSNGEYDPDPDPPTPPGPGPGPSGHDPNYDPNSEPGDMPDPAPGSHDRQYDPVPIPGLPTVTAVGAGFTTLYRPSETILRLLASELYSDNAIQIISNFFSDPYDMIAGLSIVPFMVPVSGRAKHRIGLFESDISMDVVSSQYVTINCGDILIDKYYNSFMDYSPYTRLILWLPYIGYQEIDPDEVMGDMLNVTYHCDCLSGACTAFVNTGVVGETGPQIPRVIAQFSGNCNIQIPTAAASYDNLIASSINILTTAAGTYLGAVSGIASMAANNSKGKDSESIENSMANQAVHGGQSLIGCAGDVVRSMKPGVIRNGTPGSSAGYMGVQTPYLIKIVPRSSIPDDSAFMAIKGYPSNKTGTLSEYSGFCVVEDIQLNNVPATIGEINEIYDLLKGGVIL